MIFKETSLENAFLIEIEPREDSRGLFARTFCAEEFRNHAIEDTFVQCNISFNKEKGTLRGMHFQEDPCEEGKLVRCTKGCIYDVIIDLRKNSQTFGQHEAFELNEENRLALYIPKGFAHGFQTMDDNSEVFYQMTEYFSQNHSKGIRWDDPFFKINWPINKKIISEKYYYSSEM